MSEPPCISEEPAVLQHPELWTQTFTNAVAHILQISHRLCTCSWADKFSTHGHVSDPSPDLESLTLPLLLLRQVVGGKKDQLMERVSEAYETCLPDSSHSVCIRHHCSELSAARTTPLPLTRVPMIAFLDAIMYGTCLFHTPDGDTKFDGQRELIKKLNTTASVSDIMIDLTFALGKIWHHVSAVAAVCGMDSRSWPADMPYKPTFVRLDGVFKTSDWAGDCVKRFMRQQCQPRPGAESVRVAM